jgi:hypothetical protein
MFSFLIVSLETFLFGQLQDCIEGFPAFKPEVVPCLTLVLAACLPK